MTSDDSKPRAGFDSETALPPDVNPAGLPPREPFVLAHSPVPGDAWTGADERPRNAEPLMVGAPFGAGPSTPETLQSPWDETPATARLATSGTLDAWRTRAEAWEHEARHDPNGRRRAEGLVFAAECWALVGERERASRLADEAALLAPTSELAQLEQRQLAHAREDWPALLGSLELAATAGATPEARTHALHYAADLSRTALDKPDAARRHLHHAAEVGPSDDRASLIALVEALTASASAPRAVLPPEKWSTRLDPLREKLKALREPSSALGATDSLALRFRAAGQALSERRLDRAAQIVSSFGTTPELREPALWLAAALAAPSRDSRDLAISCLTELLTTSKDKNRAESALIARALEQSSAAALEAALARADASLAAGVTRVTLHVLTDDPSSLDELGALAPGSEPYDGLEAALRLALDPTFRLGDTSQTGLAFDLGRAAADATSVGELVAQCGAPENAGEELAELLAALRVEAAIDERSPTRLADALGAWPRLADGQAPALAFLRGVLYEQGNDPGRALEAHREALSDPLTQAAAVSAIVKLGTHAEAVAALGSLAEAAAAPESATRHRAHAAWLAAEAESGDAEALLEAAAQNAAGAPFATLLGERRARARGDRAEVASWLSRERDHADRGLGRALLLLREASEEVTIDPSAAALLFQEALTLVPKDLSTRLIHENLDDTSPGDRATWREEVASLLEDPDLRRALYEEAAILYEQAAEHEDAQRAALELTELSPSNSPLEAAFAASVAKRHEVLAEPSRTARATAPPPETLPEDTSNPKWLGVALYLEWQALESGNLGRLQEIGRALARRLPPEDARVPTFFSIVASLGQVEPNLAIEWLEPLLELPTPPLWALRYGLEYASDAGELRVVLRACERLLEADLSEADRAALSYRAGRAALGLGRLDEARTFLVQTLKGSERHLGALDLLVEIHTRLEDYRTAAELLMELSEASTDDERRIAALFQASGLFETRLADKAASRAALEGIVELDVTHAQAFGRLVKAYRELPAPLELLRLYQVRMDAEPSPEAKAHWEQQRNRVLGAEGGPRDMRTILEERLREAPDDLEALEGLASLSLARGDAQTAEQAWIRIAKVAPGEPIQRKAYERLAHLYEQVTRNPERLMACYRELAEAYPSELGYWRKLVQACLASKQVIAALKAQTALVNYTTDVPQKRTAVIQLSLMYEHHAGDAQRAEGSLEKARAAWPFAPDVAQALYVLYGRRGNAAQASEFLTSARQSALLGLEAGTADPDAIALIAEVARLRGEAELEAIYAEAHAAAVGFDPPAALVPALGTRAASQGVESQIAPDLLSSALRQLVARTSAALSSVLPPSVDVDQASPLNDETFLARATAVGEAFGLRELGLVAHKGLSRSCVVLSSEPAVVALAPRLASASPATQDYHLVRAMKLAACSASAFDVVDSTNVLAAVRLMLERYGAGSSVEEAAAVETVALTESTFETGDLRTALHAVLPRLDETLVDLASQIATTSGENLDQLPLEWQRLAARTALVWLGSLRQALDAISFEDRENPMPAAGEARWRWLVANPIAWDLVCFALGDAYALVRKG